MMFCPDCGIIGKNIGERKPQAEVIKIVEAGKKWDFRYCKTCSGQSVFIADELCIELIECMYKNGLETYFSCEGHFNFYKGKISYLHASYYIDVKTCDEARKFIENFVSLIKVPDEYDLTVTDVKIMKNKVDVIRVEFKPNNFAEFKTIGEFNDLKYLLYKRIRNIIGRL